MKAVQGHTSSNSYFVSRRDDHSRSFTWKIASRFFVWILKHHLLFVVVPP